MKILIVSDTWIPEINGVVRTLENTVRECSRLGHTVHVLGPDSMRKSTFSFPLYPDIKFEFWAGARIWAMVQSFSPDYIHIATEGPLGWSARRVCLLKKLPFTTSYHTRFPDYFAARAPRWLKPFVSKVIYAALHHFHAPSKAVMVATSSIEDELKSHGFQNLTQWSRGVDTSLFQVYGKSLDTFRTYARPILLYVGRVSIEKNLRAFLDLKTTGSHVVIGDGPDLDALRLSYPQAHFLGSLKDEILARHFSAADIFVFPSKTDTFGLVLLEACASGLRVAAYLASGPQDIFGTQANTSFASLDTDLQKATDRALDLPDTPEIPRAFAARFSWVTCSVEFLTNLRLAPLSRPGP